MNSFVSQPAAARTILSGDVPQVRSITRWWLPLVALVTVVLCLPFLRTLSSLGDEGVLLHGAERMLQGDRIYADFFEFLPPGGFVLTEIWLRVAGLSMLAERSLAIIIIAGIACFTFLACRQASRNAPLAAALTIGWVVMSQGTWTQLSHHWFTTMFSMAGIWAALAFAQDADHRRRWPLISGATSGMAAMVTPTCGALAMLAALTAFFPVRRHRAALIVYVVACALVPVALLAYLLWRNALVTGFDDVILSTAAHYASIQGLPYGHGATFGNALLNYVFPFAAALAFAVYVRDRFVGSRDHVLAPAAAFCLAGLVACYPRADVFHIAFEVPLACPLLAYCADRLARVWRPTYRMAAMVAIGGLLAPAVLGYAVTVLCVSRGEITPTPRGGLAFFLMPGASEMLVRIAALPDGDKLFFYPFMPMMPFLSGRDDVSKYDVLTPGYSLPSQYREACVSALRHADWVVIDRHWTDPAELKHNFPAMRNPQPPETRAFEQALDSSFELVAQEGTFELRHRRTGVSDAVCAGMAR